MNLRRKVERDQEGPEVFQSDRQQVRVSGREASCQIRRTDIQILLKKAGSIVSNLKKLLKKSPQQFWLKTFRNSPKVAKFWSYFCKEISHQVLSKIVQSGHTDAYLALNVAGESVNVSYHFF